MRFNGKESACQCRRHRRRRFSPWAGKTRWSRKWQPNAVFSPEKSHGQRSLVGLTSQAPLSTHTWWSRQKQRAVKVILCPSAGAPPHIQYVSVVLTTASPRWYMFSFVSGLTNWLTQLDSTQRGWEAEWRENRKETPAWEDHRMMIATAIAWWWSQENSDCSSSWDITKRKQS